MTDTDRYVFSQRAMTIAIQSKVMESVFLPHIPLPVYSRALVPNRGLGLSFSFFRLSDLSGHIHCALFIGTNEITVFTVEL